MCKGCPLIPNPARALARTETRGGPSQPHPQPARKSDRKQRWRKISHESSPQVRGKPGKKVVGLSLVGVYRRIYHLLKSPQGSFQEVSHGIVKPQGCY